MRYLSLFIALFLTVIVACDSQSSVEKATPTTIPKSISTPPTKNTVTQNLTQTSLSSAFATLQSPINPTTQNSESKTSSTWQDFEGEWLIITELSQVEYQPDPIWEFLIQLMIEKELSEKLNNSSIPEQLIQEYVQKIEIGLRQGYDFVVKVPTSYSEKSIDYPLVIFLHGGIDGSTSKVQGRVKDFFQQQEEAYIVIAPVKNEIDWNSKKIEDVLTLVQENLRIDQNRIYLTGLSMGGRGTYIIASDLPDIFAAIMPLSSHDTPYSYVNLAPKLNDISIWVFHGDADIVSSHAMAVEMVEELKKYNSDVRFTSIEGGQHSGWKEIYNTPEHMQWLLSHRRD